MTLTIAPYGTWKAPVDANAAVASFDVMGFVLAGPDCVYYTLRLAAENGRTTLMRLNDGGSLTEITPAPIDVGTRIHEYGGLPFISAGDDVFFVDDRDQRIYLASSGTITPVTRDAQKKKRFGDLVFDPERRALIAVMEDHETDGEAIASIVLISLEDGTITELVSGADFYAAPALSHDTSQLAWISWNHPDMPWDATRLYRASVVNQKLSGIKIVAGQDKAESVLQPQWGKDGTLYFMSDRSGYWNIWDDGGQNRAPVSSDCAGPLWQLGMRFYVLLDNGTALSLLINEGFGKLALFDLTAKSLVRTFDFPITDLSYLSAHNKKACFLGVSDQTMPLAGTISLKDFSFECVAGGAKLQVSTRSISRPSSHRPEPDGFQMFYYPPANEDYSAPDGTYPPVILRCHGGPSARSSASLQTVIQYWTLRGFAWCELNYRGSTGFGRSFRNALYGNWGKSDVEDCVRAARYLVEQQLADPEKVLISGSSAGGYTVLCALTFTDRFSAGSSSYGIGDLCALAEETHKFEKHYLDKLIAPYPEGIAIYKERSPLFHAQQISSPCIFFQGTEDKVVPPVQARSMAEALKCNGITHEFIEFEGEAHGFRKPANRAAVLEKEFSFFCKVLNIQADGA